MLKIKKGASFRLALQFTEQEWESIFPVDLIVSQYRQGDTVVNLEVEADALTRCIYLRSETTSWNLGKGSFDVKLIRGGLVTIIPELTNVEVQVIKGVTQ